MNELLAAAKAVIDAAESYKKDFAPFADEIRTLRAAVERAELESQTETELFTYAKGYEAGKEYVTHRVKRALDGGPVPASIDCGLFEIKDKSTVTNLNLADGIYRLLAVREER